MTGQETIPSIKLPALVSLSGFEGLETIAHMLEWLGRDLPFRQFIVGDVERELYAQDQDSQLIYVQLSGEPKLETKVLPANDGTSIAVVKKFDLLLQISLVVRSGNGQHWRLSVSLSYSADNLNLPDKRTLQFTFSVTNAESMQPSHA